MCKVVEIGENLTVASQHDASPKATWIVVINRGPDGTEWGIELLCKDNGQIEGGYKLTDGVDLAEYVRI